MSVLKPQLGYDDSLDVFGIHGVGGMWGTIATGIFASVAVNEGGANGLLFGNLKLFLVQGLYMVVCILYAVAMTWVIFKVVDTLFCMRVAKQDELVGLDLSQHHEAAYTVLE